LVYVCILLDELTLFQEELPNDKKKSTFSLPVLINVPMRDISEARAAVTKPIWADKVR